ncbi:MAG: hypothetical protein ACTSYB_14590 [Candidatus Helarchaeota archaeon]
MPKHTYILCLILMSLTTVAPLTNVYAQQSWTFLTTPLQLTSWFDHVETPDLAVDSSGFLHIVYRANDGSNLEIWYTSNDGNSYGNITGWETIDDDIYLNYRFPAIALDSNGYAHVAWLENPSTTYLFYSSNIGGFTPSNVVQLTPCPSSSSDPVIDIAIDKSNTVWIVFRNSTGVYVINNKGGSFNPAVQIPGTNGDEAHPQIAANNYPHVVFEDQEGIDKGIYYSKNVGAGFITPIQLTDNSFDDTDPAIAVDSNEIPYIAWTYDWTTTESGTYEIFYSYNLQSPSYITYDSYNQSHPAIAVTSAGVVFIVYEKDIGGGNENIFIRNSADNFATEVQLTSNPYSDLYPRIDIDGADSVHVIWYGYDGTVWSIFYNYGKLPTIPTIPGFSFILILSTILGFAVLYKRKLHF